MELEYDRMPSACGQTIPESCREREKEFDELQNEESLEECH